MGLKERAIKLLFHGIVSEKTGRFVPDNPTWYTQLSHYRGKRISVHIQEQVKQRSNNQNSYYWGVCVALLADHLGYTPEELHEAAKWELLRVRRDNLPDTVKSTATLSTSEMEDYLERFRQWALIKLAFQIPLPHEVNF